MEVRNRHSLRQDDDVSESEMIDKYWEMKSYEQSKLPPSTERWKIDIFDWWSRHAREFPNLAEMAADYLSIPGGSVDVERLFSVGSDIITADRNKLSAETVSAIVEVQSWIKAFDINWVVGHANSANIFDENGS